MDVIITNPPFQKGNNNNYYISFLKLAKYAKIMAYIIPSRHLIPSCAHDFLKQFQILLIRHTIKFENIFTYCSYVVFKKTDNPDNTSIPVIFSDGIHKIDYDVPMPIRSNNWNDYLKLLDYMAKPSLPFTKENPQRTLHYDQQILESA